MISTCLKIYLGDLLLSRSPVNELLTWDLIPEPGFEPDDGDKINQAGEKMRSSFTLTQTYTFRVYHELLERGGIDKWIWI